MQGTQKVYRSGTLNEVKTLTSGFDVILSPFQASAGLYLVDLNGCNEEDVVKAMSVSAMQAEFIFEHIITVDLYGRPTVEIRLRVKNVVDANEPVYAGRVCIRKPANFNLEPKPKRLAHMGHFIKAGDFTSIRFEGAETAFVGRLFDEGMLEKSPENPSLMRPTPEGVKWYTAHTAHVNK